MVPCFAAFQSQQTMAHKNSVMGNFSRSFVRKKRENKNLARKLCKLLSTFLLGPYSFSFPKACRECAKDPEEFCSCRLQQWEMAFISINILVLTPCQVFSKGISKLWVCWQPPNFRPLAPQTNIIKQVLLLEGKSLGWKILLCLIHFGWASVIFTRGQDLTGTSYFQAWWWKKWYWIYIRRMFASHFPFLEARAALRSNCKAIF